jgi:hypothetical protein
MLCVWIFGIRSYGSSKENLDFDFARNCAAIHRWKEQESATRNSYCAAGIIHTVWWKVFDNVSESVPK